MKRDLKDGRGSGSEEMQGASRSPSHGGSHRLSVPALEILAMTVAPRLRLGFEYQMLLSSTSGGLRFQRWRSTR